MAFADIDLRDNGSGTFDIALSGAAAPSGNSNFFLFFDELSFVVFFFLMILAPIGCS